MSSKLKAVAVKYPENAECPFITATAKGEIAERLVEIARDNKIPVIEDKVTADILSVQEIGEAIPPETWNVIAKIFAFILNKTV